MWQERVPELETERLLLRAFKKRDLADLPLIDADPEVTYFRGISPLTQEQSAKWIAEQARPSKTNKRWLAWCVRRKSDDAFIGMTLLRNLNPDWREWEVGYCLAKAHWGQGYASEAVRRTLAFGYGPLNAHRVVANTYPENQPSRKLLEKLGFREEGYQVQNYFEHEAWQDNVQYALLDHEFKA